MQYIAVVLIGWILTAREGHAQSDYVGSYVSDNSPQYMEEGMANLIFSETLIIDADADWEIHGTVEIWSRYIYIHPSAKLHGTGRLILHDPGQHIYYDNVAPSATLLDANGNPNISLAIELRNKNNLLLAGFQPNGFDAYASNDLVLNASLDLAVDGACVELNGNKLGLGKGGDIQKYSSRRMIITGNKVESQLYIHTDANRTAVFPIGIVEGDYTPAILSPEREVVLYASVQDYSNANVVLDNRVGMDRVWYIYSDQQVNTVYTLQHNQRTNGTMYIDQQAGIWQYVGGDSWIAQSTEQLEEGLHAMQFPVGVLTDALKNYFTKVVEDKRGPEAIDDQSSVEVGGEVLIAILVNDIVGSSPILLDRVRILEQPRWGTVAILSTGEILYVSNVNQIGQDKFVYLIEDENGLTSQAEVSIILTPRALFIPNVFTPNGDGINDYFEIRGIEIYDRIELVVVNRWGNEVFKSRNYDNKWNGSNLESGTYYYIMTLVRGGKETVRKSWVLIKNE
ncbi:hypothetical protein GCM10011418_12910 [Sphingobacterium alkalisoli]|nr:gliding motility-associated C-terminal domain-containing protein [Sphingobacterium alkalisoli]GGH13006.1 hypothetical protein GCM10011418_12910 [Sphingobacterium alkalisoli]